MKIEFGRAWSEFLSLLTSHRVRFVIVGGHAVAGQREPRLTEDLDVLVDATLANASRLREALIAFGFGESVPPAPKRRYVVCLSNEGYSASLEPKKIYVALGPDGAEEQGFVRVIDESGEDYLYPAERFAEIVLPRRVARAIASSA